MSGKCTGWVGEHGPHPDDLDRTGKKYGARARGMRLVLLAVADCANVEGEHSHPGIANVARFSLYSTGQCRRTLEELEAEGWLIVTEQGGGRGRATVYRVPMSIAGHPALERRASCAGSDPRNARISPTETRASEPETRAPQPETRASGRAPNGSNGSNNGTPNGDESPEGDPPAIEDPARAITVAVWEASSPKPATPFIGVVKIARRLLDAGHDPDAITAAMIAVPTISTRWVEAELNRSSRPRPPATLRPVDDDRDAPTGRIAL